MITISRKSSIETLKMPWKKAIAVGRAYDLLRNDTLEHLKILQKEIGYGYTRFHAIFHDDMNVYSEDAEGNPVYQWHQVDKILDETLKLGLRHILELNPMPSALASGTQTIFYYNMNVTPPKSYEKWGNLVREFVKHLYERYGREEVVKWYFEVWNEPDLKGFWSGDRNEYFKLYDHAALAVKSVDPAFRIGGPATSKGAWISEFIEHCTHDEVPLDFISTHQYPQDEYCLYPERKDSPHLPGMFFIDSVNEVRKRVLESSRPEVELLYTEWNTQSVSPGRKVTWTENENVDNLYAASMICHICTRLDKSVEALTWWVASDIFEELRIPQSPFSSTYGLLTVRGTPKASFNAFRFLARMRGQMLEKHIESENKPEYADLIACRDGDFIRILAWNYIPHEMKKVDWRETIRLDLPELAGTKYQAISAKIGEGKGSAYETWLKMGAPVNPTRMQEEFIAAASEPEYSIPEFAVNGKTLELKISLKPWELIYIEIAPVGRKYEKAPEGSEVDDWNQKMSDISKKA